MVQLARIHATPVSPRARDYARSTLKPRHRPIVRAFAEALFATEEGIADARLDAFVEEVDGAISNASKTLRFGLVTMLDGVRWAPLFVIGRFATFENLSLPDRVLMLERMESAKFSPLQLVFVAYKTLMSLLFFEEESELYAMGYWGSERHRYKRGLPIAAPKAGERVR